MVYYFRSTGADNSFEASPRFVYMGKDQLENDDLIKFGFESDVWFHVDDYSSAHVYLRLLPGESWDQIPESLLVDCAQLVKANSIQGNKKDDVKVIYTPWTNLRKSKFMKPGEVGFKNHRSVKKFHVRTRDNAVLNRLKKTREELVDRDMLIAARNARDPEVVPRTLRQLREERLKLEEEQQKDASLKKEQKKSQKQRKKDAEEEAWLNDTLSDIEDTATINTP